MNAGASKSYSIAGIYSTSAFGCAGYKSSNVVIGCIVTVVDEEFSSAVEINSKARLALFCSAASELTKRAVAWTFRSKCAIASGAFRGDIAKTAMFARAIPMTEVQYVIESVDLDVSAISRVNHNITHSPDAARSAITGRVVVKLYPSTCFRK